MTPANAPEAYPQTLSRAVALHGFKTILRATRLETAPAQPATQNVQKWLQRPTVKMDQKYDEIGHSGAR